MIRTHYDNLQVTRNAVMQSSALPTKSRRNTIYNKFDGAQEEAERVMKILNVAYAIPL